MGGPSHLSEVETFLNNMFADPCILPISIGFVRKIVGRSIVRKHLEAAKRIYRAIGGKSPITELTFSLVQKLQELDPQRFYSYVMRYTPPYAPLVLEEMRQKGIEKIYLFSMYPQYSIATTLSSFSSIKEALKRLDYKPEICVIDRHFDDLRYVQLSVDLILESLGERAAGDFSLILSAHSLPESFIKNNDPYQSECEASLQAFKRELQRRNVEFSEVILSYQSKLGPIKWIGPSTKSIIPHQKGKNILIAPLGFSIDNSETIYEINIEYRKLALEAGVKDFIFCPCANDRVEFAQMIFNMIEEKGV